MHLLQRDGRPCTPATVGTDHAGAALLADLYAFGAEVTVRAMMNTSIDGAVAGADGTSGSLRNPDDSFVFGVLRALADVVLVGAATVRAEGYRRPLGRADLRAPSRRPAGGAHPMLAIMSSTGELPATVEAGWPTLLVTPSTGATDALRRSGLPESHLIVADSPGEIVAALSARGLRGIQLEGGPSALGRFAAVGALDELCLSTSHLTVGGPSPRLVDGPPRAQAWSLRSLLVGEHATCARYRRSPEERS